MGLKSKIGLGTVQFGIPYGVTNTTGQTPSGEVTKILQLATQAGINMLDTASAYGTAETVLGNNDLNKFQIVSKFLSAENTLPLLSQFGQTLQCLGVDALYGYLAHRPMALLDNPGDWETLCDLKEQKKVQKIGFSLNEVRELELLLERQYQPDLIQVPYNYFDHRFEHLMQELKQNGCEIHTRSAFLQGLFFAETPKLQGFFEPVKARIESLQQQFGGDLSAALLQYVLTKPFIDKVIMGVENHQQLKDNLENLDRAPELPENDLNVSEVILMPSNWPK